MKHPAGPVNDLSDRDLAQENAGNVRRDPKRDDRCSVDRVLATQRVRAFGNTGGEPIDGLPISLES